MSEISKTNFSSLPREIRDQIYGLALAESHADVGSELANTVSVGHVKSTGSRPFLTLFIWNEEKLPLLSVIHEWAAKSRVAQEAQELFYANWHFRISAAALPLLFDPTVRLSLRSGPDTKTQLFPQCLRSKTTIRNIDVIAYKSDLSCSDNEDSATDVHGLKALLDYPNLQRVYVVLEHGHNTHPFTVAVPTVAKYAQIFRGLQARIGVMDGHRYYHNDLKRGLMVTISLEFPISSDFNLTWMWNPPKPEILDRVRDGNASGEDTVRALVAEEINGS